MTVVSMAGAKHERSCLHSVCDDCAAQFNCLKRWFFCIFALWPIGDMLMDIITLAFFISFEWPWISTVSTLVILGQWRFTTLLASIHPKATVKNILILYIPFAWLVWWEALHLERSESKKSEEEDRASPDEEEDQRNVEDVERGGVLGQANAPAQLGGGSSSAETFSEQPKKEQSTGCEDDQLAPPTDAGDVRLDTRGEQEEKEKERKDHRPPLFPHDLSPQSSQHTPSQHTRVCSRFAP